MSINALSADIQARIGKPIEQATIPELRAVIAAHIATAEQSMQAVTDLLHLMESRHHG